MLFIAQCIGVERLVSKDNRSFIAIFSISNVTMTGIGIGPFIFLNAICSMSMTSFMCASHVQINDKFKAHCFSDGQCPDTKILFLKF